MRLLVRCAAAVLILTSALSATAQELMPEDLGALAGDPDIWPQYINRNGHVIGTSWPRLFIWTETAGIVYVPSSVSTGFVLVGGINDDGQVVGTDYRQTPYDARAFLWTEAEGVVDLGSLGGSYSSAAAVNNRGQVAGQSFIADNSLGHAFLWTPGAGMRDLGALSDGMNSDADAMSNHGHVVGWSNVAISQAPWVALHAFLWAPDSEKMHDLGTLSGPAGWSFAAAVNDSGQVVGYSSIPPDGTNVGCNWSGDKFHAFVWTVASGMQDLGTLGGKCSEATAVNNSGQVVGWSSNAQGHTRAFLWTESGGMVELPTLGGSYARANAINANGQILGESTTAAGVMQAVVWTVMDGTVTQLDALDGFTQSSGIDLSDSGQIVGASGPAGSWRPTLWRRPAPTATQLAVSGTATYGETAMLTATLTAVRGDAAGKIVTFSLNGSHVGSATTDANGVASLAGIGIAGLDAGSYPGAVNATFAGTEGYRASNGQGALTIRKANQTIAFTGAPSAEIVGNRFEVSASASSGLPVTIAASGACSILGTTATMNAPIGVCSLTADQAGNANFNAAPQATQTTAANYRFVGFFTPVENPPAMNGATAGSAVPVKFSLTGNQTLAILDGTPASAPIACDSAAPSHAVETVAAGSSGLSYDAVSDTYLYVWKTDKAWADTCRQLVLKLADGTLHRANFKLPK